MIRVAVLSAEHPHAVSYLRALRTQPDVEVVLADPLVPSGPADLRGPELAAAYGVRWVPDIATALAEGPDAVVVCTENARHRVTTEAALRAGAHVLCEKPLATTVADARAMVDAAHRAGRWLMTAYPVRFAPAFVELRELVRAGALGEPISVVGTNNGRIPTNRPWFTDPELSGGGALVDHVVHVANLVDELFDSRPVRVHAVTGALIGATGSAPPVETTGLVTVDYENGVVLTIDCSWSHPASAPNWGGLTLDVIGTAAGAHLDPFGAHVGGDLADGAAWLDTGLDLDALMIDEFLSGVRSGSPPRPDGEAGVRTCELVEAAQLSARTGEAVELT